MIPIRTMFRMIDPRALDVAFGRVLVQIAVLLGDGDAIAIDGKALRGARDIGQSARTRRMVSAYAARLRLTLATVAADHCGELEAALEVLGLIALKGKVVTADALHCNRCTVAAITGGSGGDYCLALKANQDALMSYGLACFGKVLPDHPVAHHEAAGHGRKEGRTGAAVSAKGLAKDHEFPTCRPSAASRHGREADGKVQIQTLSRPVMDGCSRGLHGHRPRPSGASIVPCTGNLRFRSGKMPPATARTMAPPTFPCLTSPRP